MISSSSEPGSVSENESSIDFLRSFSVRGSISRDSGGIFPAKEGDYWSAECWGLER